MSNNFSPVAFQKNKKRCVLAARSSVFMAELFGSMKEKAMNCIQIQDMEARVFKAMLHFIYTDTMSDIDKEGAFVIQHLLVASDRYDLERLKLICEDKLCKCIDTSTVATTLVLAERHGCLGLKKACFEFLKSPSHLKTVMATEGFDHLMTTCPSLMKELLAKVATCP
jgi:speckle-type POZ protein